MKEKKEKLEGHAESANAYVELCEFIAGGGSLASKGDEKAVTLRWPSNAVEWLHSVSETTGRSVDIIMLDAFALWVGQRMSGDKKEEDE